MASVSVSQEHLSEAVGLISSTTILAVLYTLNFILYCLSFRLFYAQSWDDQGKISRKTAFTLALATVLLLCATLDVILCNYIAKVSYIDNRTLPGGPLGSPATLSVATPLNLDDTVDAIEMVVVFGVLLWRVRVIWGGARFVVLLTVISLCLYLATAGLIISLIVITWNNDPTSLEIAPASEGLVFIIAGLFTLASLVFMTLAIIARLIFIRRKHIKLMGKSDASVQYLGIATMLIESCALETLWTIGLLISSGLQYVPVFKLFGTCLTQIDVLANSLIIYRVLSGRAWTPKTEGRLSALRWASSRTGTTTSTSAIDDDIRWESVPQEDSPAIGFRDSV